MFGFFVLICCGVLACGDKPPSLQGVYLERELEAVEIVSESDDLSWAEFMEQFDSLFTSPTPTIPQEVTAASTQYSTTEDIAVYPALPAIALPPTTIPTTSTSTPTSTTSTTTASIGSTMEDVMDGLSAENPEPSVLYDPSTEPRNMEQQQQQQRQEQQQQLQQQQLQQQQLQQQQLQQQQLQQQQLQQQQLQQQQLQQQQLQQQRMQQQQLQQRMQQQQQQQQQERQSPSQPEPYQPESPAVNGLLGWIGTNLAAVQSFFSPEGHTEGGLIQHVAKANLGYVSSELPQAVAAGIAGRKRQNVVQGQEYMNSDVPSFQQNSANQAGWGNTYGPPNPELERMKAAGVRVEEEAPLIEGMGVPPPPPSQQTERRRSREERRMNRKVLTSLFEEVAKQVLAGNIPQDSSTISNQVLRDPPN